MLTKDRNSTQLRLSQLLGKPTTTLRHPSTPAEDESPQPVCGPTPDLDAFAAEGQQVFGLSYGEQHIHPTKVKTAAGQPRNFLIPQPSLYPRTSGMAASEQLQVVGGAPLSNLNAGVQSSTTTTTTTTATIAAPSTPQRSTSTSAPRQATTSPILSSTATSPTLKSPSSPLHSSHPSVTNQISPIPLKRHNSSFSSTTTLPPPDPDDAYRSSHPFSPFYEHPATRTSSEQTKECSKAGSRVNIIQIHELPSTDSYFLNRSTTSNLGQTLYSQHQHQHQQHPYHSTRVSLTPSSPYPSYPSFPSLNLSTSAVTNTNGNNTHLASSYYSHDPAHPRNQPRLWKWSSSRRNDTPLPLHHPYGHNHYANNSSRSRSKTNHSAVIIEVAENDAMTAAGAEDSVWPGQAQLRREDRLRRGKCWGRMGPAQRVWVKILLVLLVVGGAVGVSFGIWAAVKRR